MDRATAVVRSTRSANFYEIPVESPTGVPIPEPAFASTWGPSSTSAATFSTMRRGAHSTSNASDRTASLHKTPLGNSSNSHAVNADELQFQPAFAFDVNDLVSSLQRSASTSAMHSSGSSHSLLARSASSHGWPSRFTQHSDSSSSTGSPFIEQYSSSNGNGTTTLSSDSRIQVVPVDPVLTRRGRRDALSGGETSRSQVPDNQNSIINYSMNRRKKKPIVGMPTASSSNTGPPLSRSPSVSPSLTASPASASASAHAPLALPQSDPNARAFNSRTVGRGSSIPVSAPVAPQHELAFRPTATITTPNGIEYTTEVPTRVARVTSFYEESFTF